eukprot:Pgem_evm1s18060
MLFLFYLGTTGPSKSVCVHNKAIITNVIEMHDLFDISPNDNCLLSSPYTFDPSLI